MNIESFTITDEELKKLTTMYPKIGKNSDVGNIAVIVAELYFKSLYPNATFKRGSNIDLRVSHHGKTENYEIKGTEDSTIAWGKLKVSSTHCHNELKAGMPLIRVSNIRNKTMTLYFMKYGEDFTMVHEPRWSIKRVKKI